MLWGYKPIVQLLGLFDGGLTPFFCHRMGHLMMNQWGLFCFKCFWEQTRSRRELRSRCFCEFSTWAMHKIDNPYRVSVFSLKNNHPFSMVFAWLWGYEFAVPPMFSIHVQHTRLKKPDFLSQHVEAKSVSLFNVFALPQFVRQTNANT